jgi:signal transduction histidine kinase
MLIDDLRGVFLFEGLNEEQLGDLIAAGDEVRFESGDVLFREGEAADFWWVLVAGRVELLRRTRWEESVAGVMDRPGVWAGGFRAWSDQAGYLATGRGASSGVMLRVPAAALGDRARSWFPFGVHLIRGFFQTVRNMEALSRQQEALAALGTLAAGLTHEINNPASAAVRGAGALQDTCDVLLSSLTRLAERSLSAGQFIAIDKLRRELGTGTASVRPLALADREEALAGWLRGHGVTAAWDIASALAAAGADVAWCERAGQILGADTLEPGLEWVASALSAAVLLAEVKEATERVSGLVGAMKSYAQLDRASLQFIDVTEGIDSTLVMLRQSLGDGVTVIRDYGTGVPRIEGNPADLNQVWTNIIDNAIDAMDASGTLRISTRADAEHVIIEIADTGPGMPAEVLARAFEAFYTTKDVGKGAGLGLDIARRIIVERHHGQITVDSRPGQTVFRVQLPRRRNIRRLRGTAPSSGPGAGSGAHPRHGAPRPHSARFSVRCTYPTSTDLGSNATAASMGIPRLGAAPETKLN